LNDGNGTHEVLSAPRSGNANCMVELVLRSRWPEGLVHGEWFRNISCRRYKGGSRVGEGLSSGLGNCLQVSLSDEGKPSVPPLASKTDGGIGICPEGIRKDGLYLQGDSEPTRNHVGSDSLGGWQVRHLSRQCGKGMGNVEFVMTPFTEKNLRDKIAALLEVLGDAGKPP